MMSPAPDLSASLAAALAGELMTAWRAGMCDGLEMAAKMADGLAEHPDTSDPQRATARGLRDAFRATGLNLAAGGRTR